MSRVLSIIGPTCLVGLAVTAPSLPAARVIAAPGLAEQSASSASSRALVDQYCVPCHNKQLKTGGLQLDSVDFADVAGSAEVLEKVVRKLRAGEMPPEGRPRPEPAALERFAGGLEAALDRAAASAP